MSAILESKNWCARETPEMGPPKAMPPLVWQTLFSRGIRSEIEVDRHFSPKLGEMRPSESIIDMKKAVERLVRARNSEEKVCIYGDFDLDGTSGTALLKRGLEKLGFRDVRYYQPRRLSEGYGVHVVAIEKIIDQGADVILTVDVGITDVKAAARAKELGVDFIVTDHHLPKEELPDAYAIVNPNRSECLSGLGHLCGAGVGFYLLLALRSALKELGEDVSGFDPKELLDCFVIATLTDLVPLIEENRVLCKHGLLRLAKTDRPGLRILLEELKLTGRPLNSQDVAIRFAPKLNALSRMDDGILPIDLYLIEDEDDAREKVKKVLEVNDLRRSLQAKAEKKALKIWRESDQENFVWVYSDQFHQGVVGLVATKLAQNLGLPAFIGAVNEDGNITGSSRLPDASYPSLLGALEASEEALMRFGGHAAAAGFEVALDRADSFEEKLQAHYGAGVTDLSSTGEGREAPGPVGNNQDRLESNDENFKDGNLAENKSGPIDLELAPALHYDGEGQLAQITPQFMAWYEGLGPFGTRFDAPLFRFNSVLLESLKTLKGGHLKFRLSQKKPFHSVDALWFSPPSEILDQAESLVGQGIDVLAEPQWNYFAGRKTVQLLLKDIQISKKSMIFS